MTQPPQGQWGPPPGGGYGPPNQGYGPPQGQWGPPPPPKKKHTGRNIVLGIVGAIVLIVIISAIASSSGSKKSTTSSAPSTKSSTGSSKQQTGPLDHSADVQITSCTTDPTISAPTAKLTVTNSSSKPSDYYITVAFESKDGATQYDTGNAFVQNLGPGQSSTQDAPSLKQDIPAGFTCKLVSADRTSAVG